jgi:hypothetical protein
MTTTRSPADEQEAGAPTTAPVRRLAIRPCRCGRPPEPRPPKCRCLGVDDTPIDTPDLAIYSQAEQIANGALPAWDSPDIITNDWGPFRLRPEADVTIRNLSPTTSAANARVHFYTSPFGIGTRRQLRLTRVVSLGPGLQTTLLFPLSQELLGGDPRVGVHIVIEHPTDSRSINNAGSQVHDGGYTTESGRQFTVGIPVLNDTGVSRQLQLSVLPTDLLATITPSVHAFAAFEQIVANLRIEVPAFLVGSPANEIARAVTVVAREAGGAVVGGATRLLRINS